MTNHQPLDPATDKTSQVERIRRLEHRCDMEAAHLSEMKAQVRQLIAERDAAREKIAKIMAGLEGCCMTCEPIGVRNQQMERDIADLKVCLNASADQVRAQHIEMETLRAERDVARRWLCRRSEWVHGGDGTQTANEHGWDCFKEETK